MLRREPPYTSLPKDEPVMANGPASIKGIPIRSRRRMLMGLVLFVCLVPVLYVFSNHAPANLPTIASKPPILHEKQKHLRLVVPASESNSRLCKTLLSAAVLDYPPPVLVNWNQTFDNKKLVFGGSHLAKIAGTLKHLEWIDERDQDDLVLIIDGYDTWLQLRPQVLIDRYYAINRLADQRIHRELGKGMEVGGVSQRVIFSAQKKCWPKGKNHPSCFAVPQSSLPPDVYGPQTDTDVDDPTNPHLKYRQRYLNSGLVMGPVKDLKRIFVRAQEKAEERAGIGSDQAKFADIFGEQELHRHVIALNNHENEPGADEWIANLASEYRDILDPHAGIASAAEDTSDETARSDTSRNLEFGIGLDYGMELGQPTVFSETDMEWLSFNDEARIKKVSKKVGLEVPRINGLPSDIARSEPPFFSLQAGSYPSGTLPIDKSWNQIPLYTNIWTGDVPVAIHHNAHHDGLKGRIESHWNRTWFQPYARILLERRFLQAVRPFGQTTTNGSKITWWPSYHNTAAVLTDTDESRQSYNEICGGTWDEVFSDGKGKWHSP